MTSFGAAAVPAFGPTQDLNEIVQLSTSCPVRHHIRRGYQAFAVHLGRYGASIGAKVGDAPVVPCGEERLREGPEAEDVHVIASSPQLLRLPSEFHDVRTL